MLCWYYFDGAVSFNRDLSQWNTSSVTSMTATFVWANSFNQPIGNWDMSNVQSITQMFRDCPFNQPTPVQSVPCYRNSGYGRNGQDHTAVSDGRCSDAAERARRNQRTGSTIDA